MNTNHFLRATAAAVIAALFATVAFAATFGSQQIVGNVRVTSVFRGSYGPIYVTFTPSTLAGCNGSYGGYLTATWDEARAGSPDDASAANQQFALLMLAKSTDALLEVRYRVNTSGTGWDKCAIDAVWVQ